MRRLLLAPMLLLLGGAPLPQAPAADGATALLLAAAHWCGDPVESNGDRPTILPGYGGGGFPIRTQNPRAQAFFDNGMQLAHAFAHKAAIEAFAESRRLDPDCAMCAWGEAWASGPTINYGISDSDRKRLAGIAAKAADLAKEGPVNERALIAALQLRYAGDTGNHAFAKAMDALANASPGDGETAVLAADALMIDSDYNPAKMRRPVDLLEGVLARNPNYTPAIHFYIHATELAGYPDRATPYADRLAALAPAASHLVHMPSHTYYWIGRYADAAATNVRAVEISEDNARRLKLAAPDGQWQLAYYGHNVVFGLGGALMADDAAAGLRLARPVIDMAGRGKIDDNRQHAVSKAYVAIARFAPLDEMLAIRDPGPTNAMLAAFWHYARGEAFARAGNVQAVLTEAAAIPTSVDKDQSGGMAPKMLKLTRSVLEGRAAMMRGDPRAAARAFAAAAAIEEAKPLSESTDPPFWWYPVRRDVAAALLAEGQTRAALAAADASLKRRPHDAVALTIRAKAMDALGNVKAAAADRADARRSWRGNPRAIV